MINIVDYYIELLDKYASCDLKECDSILDEMDSLWLDMSNEERKLAKQHKPKRWPSSREY